MKNKKILSMLLVFVMMITLISAMTVTAFAAEDEAPATEASEATGMSSTSIKAIAAAVVVAVVATAGAIGMAMSICKSADGMARQPEAAGKINSAMMLGLVFIETAIIYALIVAILIIFVL